MARKSKKAELRKQQLVSSVPASQRKMITQPITFAYLNGEMTVMHARIQTLIMEKLQVRLEKVLKARKDDGGFTGSLFTAADFAPIESGGTGNYLTFTVKYSELGIDPANYRYVSEAARNMQGSLVYEKEINGYVRSIVAFPVIDVPDETKGERHTDIKLHMTEDTAKDLFDMTRYHKYMKDAVFLFSSGYAGRIYLLINANMYRGTWVIGYQELRKILLTTYDKEKKRYVTDKYADINDFKKRVLEPARREIAAAADSIDCTFDYEFRYPAGKKRGTPEEVVFHIHMTDLGRNIKKAQLEGQEMSQLRDSLTKLHLTIAESNRIIKEAYKHIPDGAYTVLSTKVNELHQYYAHVKAGEIKLKEPISDYHAHALASLRNYINEKQNSHVEEITSATPAEEVTAPDEW